MSQLSDASTARHDPSLTDITNRKPFSISTTVWFTAPPPKQRAAPCVRLDRPEATAASWSARARSSFSDTAMSSPSAETTIVWATPGTFLTKLVTSQLRFWASLLSCVIWSLLDGVRSGIAANRLFCVPFPARHDAGRRTAPALQAGPVARQHAADLARAAGARGGLRPLPGRRRVDDVGVEVRLGDAAWQAGLCHRRRRGRFPHRLWGGGRRNDQVGWWWWWRWRLGGGPVAVPVARGAHRRPLRLAVQLGGMAPQGQVRGRRAGLEPVRPRRL